MIEGHGDDSYRYDREILVNFSSNIYNHIDHSKLYGHLSSKMEKIHSYPPPSAYTLEAELAKDAGISKDDICVTNGATEAIYLIAQLFSNKTSTILMPTFSEYADACRLYQHKIDIVYSIEENMAYGNVVWICNPNNPTGQVIDKELLHAVIKEHPKTYFVIDQSYEKFTLKPLFSAKEALELDNVILIHSMTKEYGIPGLRVGYITSRAETVKEIILRKMPWSVNVMAIEAAHFILANKDLYRMDTISLLNEKDRVSHLLESIYGIEPWPSDTHFMLVKLRNGISSSLKDYLVAEHGLLIRDASNFHGLDNHFFRIAIQSPDENNLLVKAIESWMNIY